MTSATGVRSHLERRFERQRVIVWHDAAGEFAEQIEDLDLDDVVLARVANDEFGLKHRVLRGEADKKFLIYRDGPKPDDIDNWLLDLELAYGVFVADGDGLIVQEIGLDTDAMREVVSAHPQFFRSERRIEQLRGTVGASDSADVLRAKMIAVLCGQAEYRLMDLTRALLRENALGKSAVMDRIEKNDLAQFHWAGVSRIYGYSSDSPSVDDFVLWLYRIAMNGFVSTTPDALRPIQLDFTMLRNDSRERETFELLSRRAEQDLDAQKLLVDSDYTSLLGVDLFEVVDQKIITDLVAGVADRTISPKDAAAAIRARRSSFWFANYSNLYNAIEIAGKFIAAVDALNLSIESFEDGVAQYRSTWYQIDQLYRQYYYYARNADSQGVIASLTTVVENFYSNKFLMPLGNAWQMQVDAKVANDGLWRSNTIESQSDFFAHYVAPVVKGGRNKLCVIISDAMRYEVGEELAARIRREDRYDAELSAILSTLPSYTQLGMAALLPHETLEVKSQQGAPAFVNGESTQGTTARAKILAEADGTAIKAEEFRRLDADLSRQLVKEYQVVYVYHDRIDATGDKAISEDQVFQAAEDTLDDLVRIVRKLTSANANNIVITADHGFLYQDAGLAESDYLSATSQGDEIGFRNRRFTIGRGLKPAPEFVTLTSQQLGLVGDVEVQIPKSINRVRLPGPGHRFVHGGATLQEVVVPVISISKKRTTDTSPVAVELLRDSNAITTGQLSVKLLQQDAVADKVLPRTLRIGLYDGEDLISNQVLHVFDSDEPDKADRYTNIQLILNREADALNNHQVELRLEEPIARTNQWRTYTSALYTLKRSFTTDFDF